MPKSKSKLKSIDGFTPRIALTDEKDADVLIQALAVYGHAQVTAFSDRSRMYESVGKDVESAVCLSAMIAFTERVTGLLDGIRAEVARLESQKETDTDGDT